MLTIIKMLSVETINRSLSAFSCPFIKNVETIDHIRFVARETLNGFFIKLIPLVDKLIEKNIISPEIDQKIKKSVKSVSATVFVPNNEAEPTEGLI